MKETGVTFTLIGEGHSMKWMTIEEIEKLELGFHQEGIIPILKITLA